MISMWCAQRWSWLYRFATIPVWGATIFLDVEGETGDWMVLLLLLAPLPPVNMPPGETKEPVAAAAALLEGEEAAATMENTHSTA